MRKKILFTIGFIFLSVFLLGTSVYAQNNDQEFVVDENIGLEEIRIPFFPQVNTINSEYATFFSWGAFIANLAILGLIVFWVYRILIASVKAMRSAGNSEELAESWKQVQSVFIGAAATMVVPILLSIIGVALNVGYVWDWPLAFRSCDSPDYEYYFQALEAFGEDSAQSRADVDALCFGT